MRIMRSSAQLDIRLLSRLDKWGRVIKASDLRAE